MAAINDLIAQIENPELRVRIQVEVDRMNKQRKFGLVFEEHLPECVPLYGMPIKKGCKVALKTGKINEFYTVMQVEGDNVYCTDKKESQLINFLKQDIVCIAEFGEPIYPYLKQIDSIYNSDDKDLPTHALIQADNYHALQLLEYLYAGKVDCIYIDPPYNTGARDWKYDTYRHSKWLSMMKKRLLLAKKLLNPTSGVLIATIDEHEVHHLRCLLEELFSDFYIQMVTYVSNPTGATQGRFSRIEEYAIYCFAKDAYITSFEDPMIGENVESKKVRWKSLLRSGTDARRTDRKNMFYPVFVDSKKGIVIDVGQPLPFEENPSFLPQNGYDVVWPIRADGSLGRWSVGSDTFRELIKKGYVQLGKYDQKRKTYGITYVSSETQKMIEDGTVIITGKNEKTGVVSIEYAESHTQAVRTVWYRTRHNAGVYGTNLLSTILCNKTAFTFPKSLYSTKDAISTIVANKQNSLIVDFFAGSGTTLHAVNLLNAEDGGKRQCIMVTNNEVSDDESKTLTAKGFSPYDKEWEELGIAQYVNWPRTKCSILGNDIKGNPINGEYLTYCKQTIDIDRKIIQIAMDGDSMSPEAKKSILSLQGKIPQNILNQNSNYILDEKYTISILFNMTSAHEWLEALEEQSQIDEIYIVTDKKNVFNQLKSKIKETLGKVTRDENIKLPMSDGFKANAVFFKLGFLDKTSVQLGRQFKELIPLLWLKAGGWGKCPDIEELVKDNVLPPYIILPENRFAVLIDEKIFAEFEPKVNEQNDIWTAFIVTDFEKGFKSMSNELRVKKTYQLYRDYLDNFRINTERN